MKSKFKQHLHFRTLKIVNPNFPLPRFKWHVRAKYHITGFPNVVEFEVFGVVVANVKACRQYNLSLMSIWRSHGAQMVLSMYWLSQCCGATVLSQHGPTISDLDVVSSLCLSCFLMCCMIFDAPLVFSCGRNNRLRSFLP